MNNKINMFVTKRDNSREEISFDKITSRIKFLSKDLDRLKVHNISLKTINSIYDGISTSELDNISANICATLASTDYQYNQLGGRILVSSAEKNIRILLNVKDNFCGRMNYIQKTYNKLYNRDYLIPEMLKYINENSEFLNNLIDYRRDYNFEFFGYKTLEKAYLVKFDDKPVESPQDLFLRVAVAIHYNTDNKDLIQKTYDYMSNGYFTHATPTLFNAGVINGQFASCFLVGTDDSIEGMYKNILDCAKISKGAGGIGIHISNVRAKNSIIKGSNGRSNGIIKLLKVLNETSRHVTQGGKRPGSFAIYLEPWHADVKDFLELKKAAGADSERCRDLFLALWIPDLFMKMVSEDGDWYLMSPDECPNLNETYGKEFEDLYNKYISEKKYREKVKAIDIWERILVSQIETGVPYITYKDKINERSNQKNIGIIKSSNLCVAPETEILTDQGYKVISELKDQYVNVWNGFEFSNVQIKQTGTNQKLILVETSDGNELFCTPYHKFYVQSEDYHVKIPIIFEAKDLKTDMKLMKCNYPIIKNGLNTYKYPYTAGLFSADGTYCKAYDKNKEESYKCSFKANNDLYCSRHQNYHKLDESLTENNNDGVCSAIISKKPKISLYDEKKILIDYIDIKEGIKSHETDTRIDVLLPIDLPEKYSVPIDQNINIRLKWFAGFIDGDGTIAVNGSNKQLQLCSNNKNFLIKINRMLNTMGINGKLNIGNPAGKRLLPDGKGGKKYFDCQTSYRLLLTSCDLYKLSELGLKCYRLKFDDIDKPQRDAKQFVKISKVSDLGDIDDTYCFTEPKNHTGIFNGILTGQCAEITEVSNIDTHSVCNLASIAVNKFYENNTYNWDKLKQVAKLATINLNKVIDINNYPTLESEKTNKSHRPIGVGIQGLADLFCQMKIPFDSQEAINIDGKIMECIYYGCIEGSVEMAQKEGPYDFYKNSDFDKNILQFDYDNNSKIIMDMEPHFDWNSLKEKIKEFGMRNSLLTALMPTASTSQILGNNECFEPYTSNIYTRSTQAGEFIMINKHLIQDLVELNLWDGEMRENIIINNGSVQDISNIPNRIKEIYKTVWEIKQKFIIDHSVVRGYFVDQSQSQNLFFPEPDTKKLHSAHLYSWRSGLKTGMYYLRTKPATSAIKFTIDANKIKADERRKEAEKKDKKYICNDEEGICLMCSA